MGGGTTANLNAKHSAYFTEKTKQIIHTKEKPIKISRK